MKYDLTFSAVMTPSGSKSYSYPIANTGTGLGGEKELSEVTTVPPDFPPTATLPLWHSLWDQLEWKHGEETSVILLVNQPIFPVSFL